MPTNTWFAEHPWCTGCPHPNYVHASQRTPRHPGKDTGRPQTDPWLTPEFKAAHPGLGRGELALAWLIEEFSGDCWSRRSPSIEFSGDHA